MTPLSQLLGLSTIVAAILLGDSEPGVAFGLLGLTWLSQALPALRSDEARIK